ncbi:MAG: XRE family transcriptional regulator [Firmicutes bacterium HGW-Firmicutes-16]|nr:MAG: XRE family transcriptional regulator [Firmicutes bacterium HGW-Firmicutes-16]
MKNLKNRRKMAGLTQVQLAEILKVGQSTVAAWESGEAYPTADKLPEIARAVNCTIDDLYVENEEKEAM